MSLRHLFRDLIIFFANLLGVVTSYRLARRAKGPLVRVLVFHDVDDPKWFKRVIEMLMREFLVLTPEAFHKGTYDESKIIVLLTFDDGYQSWIDNCLPVLDAYGLKGLFFINSGLLECAHDEDESTRFMKDNLLISPKQPLTWEGAQKLASLGHTIGGHSKNHANLAELSEGLMTKEVVLDKELTESKLDVRLVDFAYPFGTKGYYDRNVAQVIYEQEYQFGYTAISGYVDLPAKDNFSIQRMCIERHQPLYSIKLWVKGGYDIFNQLREITGL